MSKTKTTPNKVAANRRNAKKSTGPRSAAGKAKSSRNAVKHGLLAGRIVLADNAEEDPQQFNLLLDGLREDYQPQSTIETMLVERLAASFWRLRRAYRFEVESIKQANQPHPLSDAMDQLARLAPRKPIEHILPVPHMMERLVRYETMIDRELLRTMRQLELHRRLRKIEQGPDHPDGTSHWQQAASGTPTTHPRQRAASGTPARHSHQPTADGTPVTQPQCEQHGQTYSPMPPSQSCSESKKRVAAGASAGRKPTTQKRPTRGSTAAARLPQPRATALERCARSEQPLLKSSGTPSPRRAKAPAPNEPTARPNAGSARRCAPWHDAWGMPHARPYGLGQQCGAISTGRRTGRLARGRSVPRPYRPGANRSQTTGATTKRYFWTRTPIGFAQRLASKHEMCWPKRYNSALGPNDCNPYA